MKIVHVERLQEAGSFPISEEWNQISEEIHVAISKVVWPPGSDKFTIYPQSGKKRGEGNGVTPIKLGLIEHLKSLGWVSEGNLNIGGFKMGGMDIARRTPFGDFCVEWETGNISSSHRALNKMALGMLKKVLIGGVLIVPTRKLYPFLTDRIGNYAELEPYLDLWKAIPIQNGVLEIVAIEHDAESFDVPRIPKGTDGRSAV